MNRNTLSLITHRDILGGANTAGLLALSFYIYKQNLELTNKIKSLEDDLSNMKMVINENNKRSNIAFTRLNQRIDHTIKISHRQDNEQKIVEINDEPNESNDEIGSALETLMQRRQ